MTPPEAEERLRRPRLESYLELERLPRLTVLTGGAGSGKTTLLSQAFDSRVAVWLTLTPADTSLSVLTRNVVRRLRLIVPRLSSDVVAAVEGAQGPGPTTDSSRPQAIAAALAQDLDEVLDRDIVLIFDDLQELGEGDSSDFVAALCRHSPPTLHVVTSSRTPLPFPTSRLRIAGEVQELNAGDLAFTRVEIATLLRQLTGESPPELVEEVMVATGGWPVAVALAVAAVRDQGSASPSVAEKSGLFDYLAEEALDSDTTLVSTLQVASLLPWFTSDLLARLGSDSVMVTGPASVYLSRVGDLPDGHVVSSLVQEYIVARHPLAEEDRRRILIEASTWFAGNDSASEALQCLRMAGDLSATQRFLLDHGDSLIAAGHTREITMALADVGDDLDPELALLDAEARQLLGDWDGAMRRYRLVASDSGPIHPRIAWRLGFLQHMRGEVAEALQTYERAKRGTDDPAAEAALLGWQASAHWLRGERDRARELADEALEMARAAHDPRAMATAHTVLAMVAALDGDRASNDTHYLKALEYAEQANDVVQTIRIRANRASAFLEEGELGPALAEIQVALRLADMTGFELWRAMSLSNRGQVLILLGHLEEAVADLKEGRGIFRRIGSRLEAYPLAHLGEVYRIRGDTARARSAYEEAIHLARPQRDLQALVPALSGLARLIAPHDPGGATELADEAIRIDSVIGRSQALVAAGWAAHYAGRADLAQQLAAEAANVARVRRDSPGLGEALELTAVVAPEIDIATLQEARETWSRLDAPICTARVDLAIAAATGGSTGSARAEIAAETLRRYGAMGLARRARQVADNMTQTSSSAVMIKTLGGFDVLIEGVPVPRSTWQSRVAREILWMLIAARGRPINREVLLENLWPGEEPAKSANRLSVALSTIRKVLDPNGMRTSDRFIAADRESVRLDMTTVRVDVEEFLRGAKTGQDLVRQGNLAEGIVYLRAAEDRYVGEFLEEEPYADWAIPLREQARSEYLNLASLLAETAMSVGDYDAAARRFLRMLERDAYNEPAHLGVIEAMERSGRHGTARRLYGIYVTRMAELEIEPEPFSDVSAGEVHS